VSEDNKRRFSLDKVVVDPKVTNRIMAADGDDELGSWNGENIEDLVKEIDRIEETADPNYASLPHGKNIPEDLREEIAKDLPIWACDVSGNCLVGENADKVRTIEQIRVRYEKKHGGVEAFKEKLHKEIEERNARLRLNDS
jgi:hypothetical protein